MNTIHPTNPLLDIGNLPRFSEIRSEHITPAIDILLKTAKTTVAHIADPTTIANWTNILDALEAGTEGLNRAWEIIGHLTAVADTPELRAAYNENLPRITEFSTSITQNLALFEKYKAIALSSEFSGLSNSRKKIINNEIRGFRLGGAELSENQKTRFAEIKESQAKLAKAFSDHVLDATNKFSYIVTDIRDLSGLPEEDLEAARATAERDSQNKEGWKFTLHFPSYFPILQYADNRNLRETMFKANVTRASELGPEYGQGDPTWDNTENVIEQLVLRAEEACMLGFKNYAELSLESKMAASPVQVLKFLEDLAKKARHYAEKDWDELCEFATQSLGIHDIQPWDIAYASEKLRQQRYMFSENEVRQYFPLPKVLDGLFRVASKLFDITIKSQVAEVWHPDVRFFRIERNGELIAQFYMDLFSREGKRGGAWMDSARTRKRLHDGKLQTPIAYLVCNFAAPVRNKTALLLHEDVITLFHEFGHTLHHVLTKIEDSAVAGINGVEWDAVELPSQFMENFCWEWDVIEHMTSHVDTGKSLPRTLFDKMIAARNFQSGLIMLRQLMLSDFDMHLHYDFDPHSPMPSVLDLSRNINAKFNVIPQVEFSRWPLTFSHIFSGGYAAGYYSYKWAEVLSADVYSAFEEAARSSGTILDTVTGKRYHDEILAVGGSREAMTSFIAFRGRPPNVDALLRHSGMISKN
ncbi:M3 family metallopeptidase [Candidatus Pandoraea novymonadis]|uniref:oligopeptidase A n=1 Tax=Candidatus Pandoraea novymonadis TaxID=1808959 RepID=A0ABX5FDY4_9BURK|nr:M3 family metallopeptidase [Candidatus Pandoraea novymonadis]PSB91943.1 Oligopeptidase A [Candidatus Pandoraea novymonadis]